MVWRTVIGFRRRASSGPAPLSRKTVPTAAVILIAAALAACGGSSGGSSGASATQSGQKVAPASLVIGTTSDPGTLDWQVRASSTTYAAGSPAYDDLVAFNQAGNTIVPYLAKSWVASPAAAPKKIVFTLKTGATCSDGTPVTPEVVYNSMQRFLTVPKLQNGVNNLFGAGPFKLSYSNSADTFTISSQTPFATMLQGFTEAGIICPAGLAAAAKNKTALQTAQYGSGPYTLVSYTPGVSIVWKKRAGWDWGPAGTNIKTMPDSLTWKIVPDETTLAEELLTGEVNLASVSGPDVAHLASDSSLVEKTATNYFPIVLAFNFNSANPTSSLAVRKAVMAATNGVDFMKAATGSSYVVTDSYLNPSQACYDSNVTKLVPAGGVQQAQSILKSAGYTISGGKVMQNGKQLTLTVLSSPAYEGNGGEYEAQVLTQVGINVNLHNYPATTWVNALLAGQYDVALSTGTSPISIPFFEGLEYFGTPAQQPFSGDFGAGLPGYFALGQEAIQQTSCTAADALQQQMITGAALYPVGDLVFDVFGQKNIVYNAQDVMTFNPRFFSETSGS
jgi:peptide/nickel transport system substrate-binding protein